ncbi:hypothetical protein [Anabaena azotica]|uniref:Uncharacterized protein n=1 Tax=Anabaena azotica FACHB-119 TaxID=947527 RepID=A0ABR8DAA3_9NOST|nr:hypothetical protein [Anabaena azotica FACHB-119]
MQIYLTKWQNYTDILNELWNIKEIDVSEEIRIRQKLAKYSRFGWTHAQNHNKIQHCLHYQM